MENMKRGKLDMNRFNDIHKIAIVGGQGTGKTVLANNLGREYDLPICHLDGIQNLANWEKRPKDERDKIIMEKIYEEKWIIDGTYVNTLEERVRRADLVIFLNFSAIERIKGVILRYMKNRGKEKLDIPGCKEQINIKFIKYTLEWDKEKGEIVKEILHKYDKKDGKILVFKKRKDLNIWYKQVFHKSISY